MNTVTTFLSNHGADGFDLAALGGAVFCAAVTYALLVEQAIVALQACWARHRAGRALRRVVTL